MGLLVLLAWFRIPRIETNLVQQPTASKGGFRNWCFQPGLRSHDDRRPQWPSCGGATCHLPITSLITRIKSFTSLPSYKCQSSQVMPFCCCYVCYLLTSLPKVSTMTSCRGLFLILRCSRFGVVPKLLMTSLTINYSDEEVFCVL